MITQTHEPIRPLRAPDKVCVWRTVFGDWRVLYGESDWPSRSSMLVQDAALGWDWPSVWGD